MLGERPGRTRSPRSTSPAPEIDVKLLSGKVLKAKDLRGKVVINLIWATWSPAA